MTGFVLIAVDCLQKICWTRHIKSPSRPWLPAQLSSWPMVLPTQHNLKGNFGTWSAKMVASQAKLPSSSIRCSWGDLEEGELSGLPEHWVPGLTSPPLQCSLQVFAEGPVGERSSSYSLHTSSGKVGVITTKTKEKTFLWPHSLSLFPVGIDLLLQFILNNPPGNWLHSHKQRDKSWDSCVFI